MNTCIRMHGVTWHFNSKKNRKMIRNTWNLGWCNVIPPDDVVKKLACLTNIWTHTPHKPEQLARRFVVPRGNNACLMTNGRYLPLTAFKCFLCLTCTNTTIMWKFGNFQGSFDLLKTFKWFSSHLMTVIQIWTISIFNG